MAPKLLARVVAITFGVSIGWGMTAFAGSFEDGLVAAGRGDFGQALSLWRPLAENGNASAQNNLGYMFQRGEGVSPNSAEAVRWWLLAASNGLADAQNNLGVSYASGFGVTEDPVEAVKWYRLAAVQGHSMAQSNLGASYGSGTGVAQNWVESTKWYQLAAEQGDAFGLSNLGVAYANGNGVLQDFVQAHKFYTLAAVAFGNRDRVGRDRALSNRALVEKVMSLGQINKAEELAAQWRPR